MFVNVILFWRVAFLLLIFCIEVCLLWGVAYWDGRGRGGSNNLKQVRRRANSNYLPRKTILKVIFALLHRCSTYLISAS